MDLRQRVVGSRQRRYEVKFHTAVTPSMPNPPVVRCYQAVYNPETGASHLLFDDVSESHIAGQSWCPPPLRQAEKAMDAFAEFHAFWWDYPTLGELDALPTHTSVTEHVANTRKHFDRFVDALDGRLTGPQRIVYERTLASLPRLWGRALRGRSWQSGSASANVRCTAKSCW